MNGQFNSEPNGDKDTNLLTTIIELNISKESQEVSKIRII